MDTHDNSPQSAYDAFAQVYDDYVHAYGYQPEEWTATLLSTAEELVGFHGTRLLDLGCGTGLSAIPMIERGWKVTGCDISARMLAVAETNTGGRAKLVQCDLRDLPQLAEFDLVWALNSSLNYMVDDGDLTEALEGIYLNLSPSGIAIFDLITVKSAKSFLSIGTIEAGQQFDWRPMIRAQDVKPASIIESRLIIEGSESAARLHRLRHFPEAEVRAAIEAAGLKAVAGFGELQGRLSPNIDEGRDQTAVYLCRRAKKTSR